MVQVPLVELAVQLRQITGLAQLIQFQAAAVAWEVLLAALAAPMPETEPVEQQLQLLETPITVAVAVEPMVLQMQEQLVDQVE